MNLPWMASNLISLVLAFLEVSFLREHPPDCSAARKGAPRATGIEAEGEGRWADHKRSRIHTEPVGLNPSITVSQNTF